MIESIISALTGFIRHNNNPLGLLILAACACTEYVFPPFPGDTVTLFGAVLVVRYGWSLPWVFASVMGGSAVGSMLDYAIGYRLGVRYRRGGVFRQAKMRRRVEAVLVAFRRYGPAYVVINRFLPGVRAIIFVAAGMAGLNPVSVLLYALISAAMWNAAILGVGYAIGANWDQIRHIGDVYAKVLYVALAAAALGWTLWWWRRRKVRERRDAAGPEGGVA